MLKLAGRSPHTIQLCEDMTPLSPSSALSQLCISLSPKRAVKSRRRLVHAHLEAHRMTGVVFGIETDCVHISIEVMDIKVQEKKLFMFMHN